MDLDTDIEVELARGTLRARGTVSVANARLLGMDDEGTVHERGSGVRLTLPEGGVIRGAGVLPEAQILVGPGTYIVDRDGELARVVDDA